MKRIWAILAVAAVSGLVGCNSDGTWKSASDNSLNENAAGEQTSAYNNPNTNSQNMNSNRSAYNTSGMHDTNTAMDNNSDNTVQLNHGNDKTTASVALTNDDRQFVKEAAAGGMYEIQASDKALMKSNDTQVKDLAQHMIDDHTKANDQLKALALRKGIELSIAPYGDQITMLSKLDSLNGSDFDKEYLSQQRQAHEDTIAKFQVAANSSSDRDIRDWAAQTLPTLREHLRMINNDSQTNLGSER